MRGAGVVGVVAGGSTRGRDGISRSRDTPLHASHLDTETPGPRLTCRHCYPSPPASSSGSIVQSAWRHDRQAVQFSCSATAEEYGAVVSCARASEPLSIVNTATSEDGKNNNSVLVTRETEPWIPTVWSGWGLQSEEQFLWPLRRQLRSPPPSSVATPWTCKLTEPWPCARVWTQSTLSLERKR